MDGIRCLHVLTSLKRWNSETVLDKAAQAQIVNECCITDSPTCGLSWKMRWGDNSDHDFKCFVTGNSVDFLTMHYFEFNTLSSPDTVWIQSPGGTLEEYISGREDPQESLGGMWFCVIITLRPLAVKLYTNRELSSFGPWGTKMTSEAITWSPTWM